MISEALRIDATSSRLSQSDQPVPPGGAPRAIRLAAENEGIDPVAELYNEALRHATDGHLRQSRERLSMLLCMAPDDGEARLLMARVLVAGQKWQEALGALDDAENCGQQVPMELRRAVEEHLRAEEAAKEEQRNALKAREQGELQALRQETRRLRSEAATLTGQVGELERDNRKWAWITAGVSTLALGFIAVNVAWTLASALVGGAAAPSAQAEAPAVVENVPDVVIGEAPAIVAEAPAPVAPPAPPPTAETAQKAALALAKAPTLDGASLEVAVSDGKAVVTGEVLSARQWKEAERVLKGVSGVKSVDGAKVVNLAKAKGTTHTVQKGDILSRIAVTYYGDGQLTKPILTANNKLLKGKSDLSVGQQLTIPAVP